jgi:signal transduction histidine kinase
VQPAQVQAERGWKVWLAPRPFTLVSTGVYTAAFLMLLQGNCDACRPWWAGAIMAAALVGLLVLDRADYILYGETPPVKAGLVLLGVRVALTVLVAAMFGFDGRPMSLFLFALLPYVALFYFGLKGSMITGALVWVAALVMMALASIPRLSAVTVVSRGQTSSYYVLTPSTVYEYVGWVAMCTIVLVFVLTSTRVTYREKEHAARAGRLLARLDASHAWLNHYAEKTFAETEERNRAASDMHDRLGHHLAAVSIQLEKALAFRDVDLAAVEQALRSAKQNVSRALADVRRSVASLRERQGTLDEPEQGLPGSEADWAEHATAEGGKGSMRWLRWLAPRSYDALATAAYLGVILIDISSLQEGGTGRALVVAALVVVLIALDRIEYAFFGERSPVPAGALLMTVRIGIVAALLAGPGLWYALLLVAFLPYLIFIHLGDKAGYASGAILLVFLGIMGLVAVGDEWGESLDEAVAGYVQTLLIVVFMLAVMAATARTVGKEREGRARAERLLAEVGEAHRQLAVASREAVAAVEARNSLARDIHDGLGHYLTATSLQVEKALAFRSIDPRAADQAIEDSKRMVSEALHEIRSTIGAVKETREAPPLAQLLEELVLRAGHRGLEISLHMEGDEQDYSRQAVVALYRAAQEGLTNVQRHSRARHATLRLKLGEQVATLDIEDDGRGFSLAASPAHSPAKAIGQARKRGYGLQSMTERLELVGGTLDVQSAEDAGTRLHISVPRLHGAHAEQVRP